MFEERESPELRLRHNVVNPVSSRINRQQFPGYQVRGGLGFVDVDGNPKYPYQFDKNNIQPRVGFAYLLSDKTVLRGGYGLYYLNVVGISASNGFGIQTPLVTSLDDDRTSTYPLANPFSQGIAQAPGSSLGLETFLGRSPSFSNPDFVNPYVHQFSIGVQRELPWRTTIEVCVRRQPHAEGAEPVGRLQRAAARRCATGAIRRKAAAPPSATSCCRIRSTRCRGSKGPRGSRAPRSRATS